MISFVVAAQRTKSDRAVRPTTVAADHFFSRSDGPSREGGVEVSWKERGGR